MATSEKKEKIICFGCGTVLQTKDENKPGYIPLEVMQKQKTLLCQRCFRLQHYSEDYENPIINADFIKIIESAKKSKALIVYVVDLFSFESSFIPKIITAIGNSPVLLVANKRDILPKSKDDERLKAYVIKRAQEKGLKVADIVLTSPQKNYNIDEFLGKVLTLRKLKDVYVVGATSTGKSTLINTLLRNYSNETSHFITTSPFPGTTLEVIKVPLDESTYIFDTPGLDIENSLLSHVPSRIVKYISPRSEIKPRTFQMDQGQSLIIGGLVRFDYLSGPKTGFTIYCSNELKIFRTKLKNADATFANIIKNSQVQTLVPFIKKIEDLAKTELFMEEGDKKDVGIFGLGWVSFTCKNQKIDIHAPAGVTISKFDEPKI